MAETIAIVGSGPSGLYAAAELRKQRSQSRVDIIERLPTPYGLIRHGVAPDHQKIKQVEKALARVFAQEGVRFCGNVEVGRDVSVDELRSLYDVVIVACGAPLDQRLTIPGADLPGVYGSAAFVAWYNGHPDYPIGAVSEDRWIGLDAEEVAVIGAGNVALDLARVLSLSKREMASTDLPAPVARAIDRSPIRRIHLFGRRGPLQAKFSPAELREMARLEDAVVHVDPRQLPPETALTEIAPEERTAKAKNLALFREYAEARRDTPRREIRMRFFWSPERVFGDRRVEGLVLRRNLLQDGKVVPTEERLEVSVGLVLSAIGYVTAPFPGLAGGGRSAYVNQGGHIEGNLWVVGWARRGPTGTIATNRADAQDVVAHVLEGLGEGVAPGPEGFDRLSRDRNVNVVSFEGWRRIDGAERAAARKPAPRSKITDLGGLLRAAEGP